MLQASSNDYFIPDKPNLICPANQIKSAINTQSTATAVWSDPSATDRSGNKITVECNPSSGSEFPIGTTTVFCKTENDENQETSCSFEVIIEGKENSYI